MNDQCRPLIDILSEIPDFRKSKGKRHPLSAILALACVAICQLRRHCGCFMCGCKTYAAIAEWGRNYDEELTKALGFSPCAATLFLVFLKINVKLLELKLGEWTESVLKHIKKTKNDSSPVVDDNAVALDGKTLKGSLKQGSAITHLLSAVSHGLGLTLAQSSVDSKTNEIGTIGDVLKNLVLEGRIISVDALLTQREVSQTIIDGGGDYVMTAKGNQQRLLDDVKTVFDGPCSYYPNHQLRL